MENPEVKIEEVKITAESVPTVKPEVKADEVKKAEVQDDNDDIFITESDRFTIVIEYYLNGKNPVIKDWSSEYDADGKTVKKFDIEFKYPSQQDVERIMGIKSIGKIDSATLLDFIEAENARLNILVRGWSLKSKLSEMNKLHPDFVKAIRDKITNEIGSIGIY